VIKVVTTPLGIIKLQEYPILITRKSFFPRYYFRSVVNLIHSPWVNMLREQDPRSKSRSLTDWFKGKAPEIRENFDHFVKQYKVIGDITVRGARNMIVISTKRKGIAYVVPRKSFIDIIFPFERAYPDTLCFHKVVQSPSGKKEFNHYFRVIAKEDVNDEVKGYMSEAYQRGL
jgi:hypothetical protein